MVIDFKTKDQLQFKLAEKLGMGKADMSNIALESANSVKDDDFSDLLDYIQSELK